MMNRWSKVFRVGLTLTCLLLGVLGLAYIVFLKVTDIGETLQLEPEIQQKAKAYGMYVSRLDFEKAFANLPGSPDVEPEIGTLFKEGNDQIDVDGTFLEGFFEFISNGKLPKTRSGIPILKRDIASFRTRVTAFLSNSKRGHRKDWDMNSFFFDPKINVFGSITRVQEFLLYDAALEAVDGHTSLAIDELQFEARIRRYFCKASTSYRGGIYAVYSARMAQLFYLRILQNLKSPSPEIVKAIRECQETPVPFDYKHLCRSVFYMGSDWFPQGKTIAEIAERSDRNWSAVPRLTKAWKLRIQYRAILSYEAGQKFENDIDALEAAIRLLSREHYGGEWSKRSDYWSMPGVNDDSGMLSLEYSSAPGKLQKLLRDLKN